MQSQSNLKPELDDYFIAPEVSQDQLDVLLANGFRHFGILFYRYQQVGQNGSVFHVRPLRVPLAGYSHRKSDSRLFSRNGDLKLVIQPTVLTDEKIHLFERHKTKFESNQPDHLHYFLSVIPHRVPCQNIEFCLYEKSRLVAASFLDIGLTSTSSVYGMFDPDYAGRSLGIYTMLLELEYSITAGKRFYYPGYAYAEPSHYDYKKRFRGLEHYDWLEWRPFTEAF